MRNSIEFYENEIEIHADEDGSNLRIRVPVEIVRKRLGTAPKVAAPAPYNNLDELYNVFMPKLAQFGVNTELVKQFLHLNCQQTKSGKRSINKLLSILQDLTALANIYGAKVNEALTGCNEPRKCTIPYVKKVLQNRTKVAYQKEKEARVAAERVKRCEVTQAKMMADSKKQEEDRRQIMGQINGLPTAQKEALELLATRQIMVEKEILHEQQIVGGRVTIQVRMAEIFRRKDMGEIMRLALVTKGVKCGRATEKETYVQRLQMLGYTPNEIKKCIPNRLKEE